MEFSSIDACGAMGLCCTNFRIFLRGLGVIVGGDGGGRVLESSV